MHPRAQDLPLRSHGFDVSRPVMAVAQLLAVFFLMGLFAVMVFTFG